MPNGTLAHAAARNARYNKAARTFYAAAPDFIPGESGYPHPDIIQVRGKDKLEIFLKDGGDFMDGPDHIQKYKSLQGGYKLYLAAPRPAISPENGKS